MAHEGFSHRRFDAWRVHHSQPPATLASQKGTQLLQIQTHQPRIADKTSDGGALKRSFTRVDPGAQLERLAMSTSGKQTRYPSIIANTIATLTNAQVFGYMSIHAMACQIVSIVRNLKNNNSRPRCFADFDIPAAWCCLIFARRALF